MIRQIAHHRNMNSLQILLAVERLVLLNDPAVV